MSEHGRGSGPNWWLRYANLNETERACVQRRTNGMRFAFSVVLIGAGVLLFLSNLGVLPFHNIWMLWPVFPIIGGLGNLHQSRNPSARVWGVFLLLFGGAFLLENFGWIRFTNSGSWPLALVLLAAGFAALFSGLQSTNRPPESTDSPSPQAEFVHGSTAAPPPPPPPPPYAPYGSAFRKPLSDFVVLGSLKRRLEGSNFEGANMATIFGNLEVDLRYSNISAPASPAVLNLTALFGAAKIRVPREWRVHISGASIFGNFEDKTIPPNTGRSAPTLVITGWSVFSSIEIED